MSNPWFRLYAETLRDKKINRICRIVKQPKAIVMGVWVILLTLANDSPTPGILLFTKSIPLTLDDIMAEIELDNDVGESIIKQFIYFDMMSKNGKILEVLNWTKRQFLSDSSTSRVRKHRAKKKAEQQGNSATLRNGCGNAPEQNRTEQNTTDQNRAEQKRNETPSALFSRAGKEEMLPLHHPQMPESEISEIANDMSGEEHDTWTQRSERIRLGKGD